MHAKLMQHNNWSLQTYESYNVSTSLSGFYILQLQLMIIFIAH